MASLRITSWLIATMFVAAMASGIASAQVDFVGTVADIVQEGREEFAAYYDPATGDVILSNGDGNDLISLYIATEEFGGFGTLAPTTISSPIDPLPTLGEPLDVSDTSISYFSATVLPPGIFNLGPILPAGAKDADSFRQTIAAGGESGVSWLSSGGSFIAPRSSFRAAPIRVITGVPEPGSLVIFGLATVGLAARRRRC